MVLWNLFVTNKLLGYFVISSPFKKAPLGFCILSRKNQLKILEIFLRLFIIHQKCVDCFPTIEPSSMESRLITVTWKSTLAAWPEKSGFRFKIYILLAPSGALISHPDLLVIHHHLPFFQIIPVLDKNIGLSLYEPLQLYQKQSLDSSAGYMCKIVQDSAR